MKLNKVYSNFTDCYYDLINDVYYNHEYESAPRGMKIYENLAVQFEITNPRNRLLYIPEREFSIQYLVAELLWYTLGENSTEWISNYSSFWKNISDDGTTANSAYGARIFKTHPRVANGLFTQWQYVIDELKKDRDSRRAVIHIRTPDDSYHAKLDVPCTLTLQYFIRDNKLHCVANMRSTDLIFGLSYDVPAFTFFQELLALELGVELGSYKHISNSLHIYEKHFVMCEKMMSAAAYHGYTVHEEMPAITEFPPVDVLNDIQKRARQCSSEQELRSVTLDNLKDEWKDWALILLSHRAGKLNLEELKKELIQSTNFPGWRRFSK